MARGAGGGVGEPVAGQAWQGAGGAGGQGGAGGDGQVQGQELCTAGQGGGFTMSSEHICSALKETTIRNVLTGWKVRLAMQLLIISY